MDNIWGKLLNNNTQSIDSSVSSSVWGKILGITKQVGEFNPVDSLAKSKVGEYIGQSFQRNVLGVPMQRDIQRAQQYGSQYQTLTPEAAKPIAERQVALETGLFGSTAPLKVLKGASKFLSKTDDLKPLIQEAKKYKSAEEFVNKYKLESYRNNTDEITTKYLSPNAKIAKEMGIKDFFSKNPLLKEDLNFLNDNGFYDLEELLDTLKGNNFDKYEDSWYVAQNLAENKLKKMGFDGVYWKDETFDGISPEQFQIWNKDIISKTKSQLTDIWKEANSIKR